MITSEEAWNLIKGRYTLPTGYSCYYRSTEFSEWIPAKFSWCILRNYYYVNGKDTRKYSYELCLNILYSDAKFPMTHFMWDLNPYDLKSLGIDYIDIGINI